MSDTPPAGLASASDPLALEAFAYFIEIVRRLRRDCPWDREQTHASVKELLVEEAYEAVEAIEEEDWDAFSRELGDVLLHVVFHSVIAEESGRFGLRDVIVRETEKLIRRHPHVFGDAEVEGTEEILQNWERIKVASGEKRSVLDGLPGRLPALIRAHRMQSKAAGVGFDFDDAESAWTKVEEELEEYRSGRRSGSADEMEREFGDLLFALVNYARLRGIDSESALRRTNATFLRRFQHIERALAGAGRTPADASLAEMDALWDEAKAAESES